MPELSEEQMSEMKSKRLSYAIKLARKGFHFSPTSHGKSRPDRMGWGIDATTDEARLREWDDPFSQFVMVAKFGHGCALDFDDWEACIAGGFDPKWIEGAFSVRSPSGGRHVYMPWHAAFDCFRSAKADATVGGKVVAELKLNNATIAAPCSFRESDESHCCGWYEPMGGRIVPCDGPSIAAWFRDHGAVQKKAFRERAERRNLHPDFDADDFLEWHSCSLTEEGWIEGSYHLAIEECPLCGKDNPGSTLAAAPTKFLLGGSGYGFACHACGVSGRAAFEEGMARLHPGWKPWRRPIYEGDNENMEEIAEVEATDEERLAAAPNFKERWKILDEIYGGKAVGEAAPETAAPEAPVQEAVPEAPAVAPPEAPQAPANTPAAQEEAPVPTGGWQVVSVTLPGEKGFGNVSLIDVARDMGPVLGRRELFVQQKRVVVVEDGGLAGMEPAAFRTWSEQFVETRRPRPAGKDEVEMRTQSMTEGEARALLASLVFRSFLRPIKRVNDVRLPVVGRDGVLRLLPEGYDPESRTMTMCSLHYAEDMPPEEAKAVLDDLFGEFAFSSPNGKAVGMAGLLGLYAAQAMPDGTPRPVFVVTKNAEGAGAGTLVMCCMHPVLGSVDVGVRPRDDDEMRKKLTSIAMAGGRAVVLDNVKGGLHSQSLEAFTTATTWGDRLLGGNRMMSVPNLATVFITSNGATLSSDMASRSLFVELHMEEERAKDRKFGRDLTTSTMEALRPRILAACWSLVRAWDGAGRPKASVTNSRFQTWSEVVGGMVEHAGWGRPCEPSGAEETADEDMADMRAMVTAMELGRPYEPSELRIHCRQLGCFPTLVEEFRTDASKNAILGGIWKRYENRRVGSRWFNSSGQRHTKLYWVSTLRGEEHTSRRNQTMDEVEDDA